MPLFFAIAGLVSAVLALVVLSAPVLLVVLVVKAAVAAKHHRTDAVTGDGQVPWLPGDPSSTDDLFADLIGRHWPAETAGLQPRPFGDA